MGNYYASKGTSNIKFLRSPEKLLKQYDNLIRSLGRKYGRFLSSEADRQELYSFIQDAFISLVKEYDISSKVDFPGYIVKMLEFRVSQSYAKPEQERRDHISPLKKETTTIEGVIDSKQISGDTNSIGFKGNDVKNKDGNVTPKAIRSVVYVPRDNEIDSTLMELIDDLSTRAHLSPIKVALVKEFYENDPGVIRAKENVAKQLNVPISDVKKEYAELKRYLEITYYD